MSEPVVYFVTDLRTGKRTRRVVLMEDGRVLAERKSGRWFERTPGGVWVLRP